MRKAIPIKLNLIWDGLGLENPHSGISTYAHSLLHELVPLNLSPILFSSSSVTGLFSKAKIEERILGKIPVLGRSKVFWGLQTGFALRRWLQEESFLRAGSKWVYHGLSNINLPLSLASKPTNGMKFVLTVHDIIPYFADAGLGSAYRFQFKYLLPKVLARADAIVCVSDWTKETLSERFPGLESRISVIENGFDQPFRVGKLASNTKDQSFARAGRAGVLCVSRYEPYKRLNLLVSLLESAEDRFDIVTVTDSKGLDFFEKNAKKFIANGSLQVRTGLGREELSRLFEGCDVLFHPSLYEGFCLPAVEALAVGKPVVFCEGSALDGIVASSNLGAAVSREAGVEAWLEAVEVAVNLKKSSVFLENLENYFASRPTWRDSALRLKDLYNTI